MAHFELNQKVRILEETVVRQNQETAALKTDIGTLKTEIGTLKIENRNLHTNVDELMHSMKFLVEKYGAIENRVIAVTSTKEENIAQELPSDVPMAVLPIVSNPAESTTAAEVKIFEDKFAKLPVDRLAAEMWKSAIENMPELSGPATADLMEKQMENFAKFITSVSSKQNFCDAVKNTCRERGYSKGIARKMQKQANGIRVQDDS